MKRLLFFLLGSLLLPSAATAQQIVLGRQDQLYSHILNEKRSLSVYVPEHAGAQQRYPVLYLLDGESHFLTTAAMVRQLSGVIPDMIVVGIRNTVRGRDLTPTHVKPDSTISAGDAALSGGGEQFMRFIEKELIPHIDSLYPAAPYRILSGHSLGGLTVVHTLIRHTRLFNAYIAIDPSLWWDNQALLKQAQEALTEKRFGHLSLFVAMANNMPPGMDTISILKNTSTMTAVTRSIIPFIKALRNNPGNGLRWSSRFYPNERHGTVQLIAQYDALRYLFNYYAFSPTMLSWLHPGGWDEDSALDAHYRIISEHLGYTVLPDESMVNNLGYHCLAGKKMDKAYRLFKRNTDNYPHSANAFDSMGDYYLAAGDKARAIASFKKSLQLQETADTRKKLTALTAPGR